jgi:hypothetical protein
MVTAGTSKGSTIRQYGCGTFGANANAINLVIMFSYAEEIQREPRQKKL